jgi:hypothetical protein
VWSTTASVETLATPEQIWPFYAAANNWKQWAPHIEWSRLIGEFEPGGAVECKFRRQRLLVFRILASEAESGFIAEARAGPGLRLRLEPSIRRTGATTTITHRVVLDGFVAGLWGRLLGGTVRGRMRRAMAHLAELSSTGAQASHDPA